MKFLTKTLALLLCSFLLFGFVSCTDDYEPVDEQGVSFMTLTVNLADEIAVPGGSVTVKYGASRNGTDEVSASLSSDGKTAIAKLDEYFASSSGKFSKLSFTVKNADGTELAVKAEKSSINFDKDGASVSLSAKSTSTSEAGKTDENADTTKTEETKTDEDSENTNTDDDSNSQNTSDDENNEEDDELSPYLPEEFKNKTKSAVYTFFDETASRFGDGISDVTPKNMKTQPQGALYAFFFFSDGRFLMTEKNFYYEKTESEFKITLIQLYKGTYKGSPSQDGEVVLSVEFVNDLEDDENEGVEWKEWSELSSENDSCAITISDGIFSITFRNTFVHLLLSTDCREWTFKRQ